MTSWWLGRWGSRLLQLCLLMKTEGQPSRKTKAQNCIKIDCQCYRTYRAISRTITLKSISEKLAATEPSVHVTSIASALQLSKTKKLQDCPTRVKTDRVAYARWYLQNINVGVQVYVGEISFNLFTHRTRGRAKRREPVFR